MILPTYHLFSLNIALLYNLKTWIGTVLFTMFASGGVQQYVSHRSLIYVPLVRVPLPLIPVRIRSDKE